MVEPTIAAENVLPVKSRVSWGAVMAGAVVALVTYFLLSVLGTAVGLSVARSVGDEELGVGAAIYAIVATAIALFAGGCVASRVAVGEDRGEAFIHGVVLWGVLFSILLWLTMSGVRLGFNAVLSWASIGPIDDSTAWTSQDEGLARSGNTPSGTVEESSAGLALANGKLAELEEQAREVILDPRTARAAWWTFAGIVLSVVASVSGALWGAGPRVIISRRSFLARRTHETASA